jgi:DHA1 family multidrug resistance protein-like MFS transporter
MQNLLTGTAIGIILPVMPIFARDLGLSAAEYGLVMSTMGISRLITNIPAAWAAEKYGRRPTLLGGNFLTAFGVGLTGLATSVGELVSFRFFTGAGGSMSMTASGLYLADISTVKNRARTIAPGLQAFVAGMAVGPGLGGYLVDNVGTNMAFYAVGGVISTSAVINFFMLPETKVFKKVSNPVADNRSTWTIASDELKLTMRSWGSILKDNNLRLITLSHTAYWTCSSAMSFTMLPVIATTQFGMSGSLLGSCFTATAILQFIGSQPAAYLSDKFGRKMSLVPSAMIVGSSCIAMPLVTSMEQFIGVMLVSALGATFWSSSCQAYVADVSSDENRSQALALLRSCGDLGIIMGAGLVGYIADFTSVSISMGGFGIYLISQIAMFGVRAKESVNLSR